MKRKFWAIIALVAVLSITFSGYAYAANPVVASVLGGQVVLQTTVSYSTGYGSLSYNNAGHPGTSYTNYIKIAYTYHTDLSPLRSLHTEYRSASTQSRNAYVSYDAPSGYHSCYAQNQGLLNQLGEVWTSTTGLVFY